MVFMPGLPGGADVHDPAHGGPACAAANAGDPAATAVQSSDTAAEAQPTPCELSAKSLLAAPPVMFETVLFGLGLLLALLAPTIAARLRIPPPRAISPPTLRVHLRLCVFRE